MGSGTGTGSGTGSDPEGRGAAVVAEGTETLEIVDAALIGLWEAVNQLARIRPPGEHYRVTVFGSSRMREGDAVYAEVRDLAERLSRLGCDVVTGGGPGLMQAANEGAQKGDPENRRASVGIRVHLPFEKDANPFVERVYTHRSFFSRLHHFVRLSDAYVVVPGGIGTTLELMMVWQLLQVEHLVEVPLVVVGPMWRELIAWARRHMVDGPRALAGERDVELPVAVATVAEAADAIEAHLARWQALPPEQRRRTGDRVP